MPIDFVRLKEYAVPTNLQVLQMNKDKHSLMRKLKNPYYLWGWIIAIIGGVWQLVAYSSPAPDQAPSYSIPALVVTLIGLGISRKSGYKTG
jgi:hypothetical protein